MANLGSLSFLKQGKSDQIRQHEQFHLGNELVEVCWRDVLLHNGQATWKAGRVQCPKWPLTEARQCRAGESVAMHFVDLWKEWIWYDWMHGRLPPALKNHIIKFHLCRKSRALALAGMEFDVGRLSEAKHAAKFPKRVNRGGQLLQIWQPEGKRIRYLKLDCTGRDCTNSVGPSDHHLPHHTTPQHYSKTLRYYSIHTLWHTYNYISWIIFLESGGGWPGICAAGTSKPWCKVPWTAGCRIAVDVTRAQAPSPRTNGSYMVHIWFIYDSYCARGHTVGSW